MTMPNAEPGQAGCQGGKESRRPPIGHCMKTHKLTQEQANRRRYQVVSERMRYSTTDCTIRMRYSITDCIIKDEIQYY
jgi:hypothetical protein